MTSLPHLSKESKSLRVLTQIFLISKNTFVLERKYFLCSLQKLPPVHVKVDLLDKLTTMELFVDEAVSRTLLPRVDGQVVEAKLVALILACTVGIDLTAKNYFKDLISKKIDYRTPL